MQNWKYIILVCSTLLGSTAFFGYWSLNQFNGAFDNLSASYTAIVSTSQISFSNKNKEEILTTTPKSISTTTSDIVSISTTSTDVKPSLVLPRSNEFYIGCTYQLSLLSSTTIDLLEMTLIDTNTGEAVGPIASGLAREYEIKPDSQGLDWKVGTVWPGEYFISISNINGVTTDESSESFIINEMPDESSEKEQENICEETGGNLF